MMRKEFTKHTQLIILQLYYIITHYIFSLITSLVKIVKLITHYILYDQMRTKRK